MDIKDALGIAAVIFSIVTFTYTMLIAKSYTTFLDFMKWFNCDEMVRCRAIMTAYFIKRPQHEASIDGMFLDSIEHSPTTYLPDIHTYRILSEMKYTREKRIERYDRFAHGKIPEDATAIEIEAFFCTSRVLSYFCLLNDYLGRWNVCAPSLLRNQIRCFYLHWEDVLFQEFRILPEHGNESTKRLKPICRIHFANLERISRG